MLGCEQASKLDVSRRVVRIQCNELAERRFGAGDLPGLKALRYLASLNNANG